MIVFPQNWANLDLKPKIQKDAKFNVTTFIESLKRILEELNVKNLAYSGGVDSTIVLVLMSELFENVKTFTIACRDSHPDISFARIGSKKYGSQHHEFIFKVRNPDPSGDDAVRLLFLHLQDYKMITCDGIDELAGGYYDHLSGKNETFNFYLERLIPDHLMPLDRNSEKAEVYLPYIAPEIIDSLNHLPLKARADQDNRKIPIVLVARKLGIPEEIISRNKYGFCDAFSMEDK